MSKQLSKQEIQRLLNQPWLMPKRKRKFLPLRTRRRRKSRFRRGQRGFMRQAGYYGRIGPGELKFFDEGIISNVLAINGTIVDASVHNIAQGTGESERIGRKCTIKSISFRYSVKLLETTNPIGTQETVRIVVYLDKQANGAAAAVASILQNDDYQSFNNLANKSRFRTLMDRRYDLNHSAANFDSAGSVPHWGPNITNDSWYKKCNIPIEFGGINGTLAEIRSNNIGVMMLVANGNRAEVIGQMRVRYSDA